MNTQVKMFLLDEFHIVVGSITSLLNDQRSYNLTCIFIQKKNVAKREENEAEKKKENRTIGKPKYDSKERYIRSVEPAIFQISNSQNYWLLPSKE